MITPTLTNAAARFMFVCNEEIVFCTSDLNHYKEVISPSDIGQIATDEQLTIYNAAYTIEKVGIEHYSWPMNSHVLNQSGELYAYTVNITIELFKEE